MHEKSFSESYKQAGVDITAGYKAVELMKQHKTFFATNDDGENIQNWLKYATKGALKV